MISVSHLRVRRAKDIPLGHLVAVPHAIEMLLGIIVEPPAGMKAPPRLVLCLAAPVGGEMRMPRLLPDSGYEPCFDFGAPATFLWAPRISGIHPRWSDNLKTGHLAVTEDVVAISGCYGRGDSLKYGYWDIITGKMVWNEYTMFLPDWELGVCGKDGATKIMMRFPDDLMVPTIKNVEHVTTASAAP